ncbi:flagellar export chaperone FlgN [Pseudooceanicola nanhaiensis]|uniref:flagellar export chaperone FlgN n=1 Tax=Pseudooceanicola nanhaiensis TaxID=375761 RepID=UPI001CD2B983|nr:flagellar export chaperone FlgN [Pseudooceanicola nanhaiensis]MCA0920382.1 flagellar protein FlgN [Pseudooceanicola nanhaiensis]
METDRDETLIDALDALLEEERRTLLSGDLTAIRGLLERKEALVEQLGALEGAAQRELEGLQVKALRNQALLDGTLRGIRTVANRMGTLRRIRRTLETYDEAGRRQEVTTQPDHQVEKRA